MTQLFDQMGGKPNVRTRQICRKTPFSRTSRAIYGKTVRFLAFLTSEMDSATSNYVKNVVHSFGTFHELNLFDSVIDALESARLLCILSAEVC